MPVAGHATDIDCSASLRARFARRGIYWLPNLFTLASLFAGFYAIVQAMNGRFESAAMAIFVAMVLDGLDGRVARLTRTQSAFGAELDSLSDMVSFGVAPALVVYVWALKDFSGMQTVKWLGPWLTTKLGWIAAFIYCACAALRLARFNTHARCRRQALLPGAAEPGGGVPGRGAGVGDERVPDQGPGREVARLGRSRCSPGSPW